VWKLQNSQVLWGKVREADFTKSFQGCNLVVVLANVCLCCACVNCARRAGVCVLREYAYAACTECYRVAYVFPQCAARLRAGIVRVCR
jgi:hypothetical protein